jgi:hypothetical protein
MRRIREPGGDIGQKNANPVSRFERAGLSAMHKSIFLRTNGSFLKKRTKKLLIRCRADLATTGPAPRPENEQSFFASFCSQK